MTSDQIEYCGGCRNYLKCLGLAKTGRLTGCSAPQNTGARKSGRKSV